MRRPLLAAATAGLLTSVALLAQAAPALAHPGIALAPTLPTDLTFSATDNVEYLGRFPEHTGTAGGFPSEDGKIFYLTDPRGVYTYDTTDPKNPVRLGSIALYQTTTGAALSQEDPDTNGKILLVDAALTPAAASSQLQVVDVSNPKALKVLASVPTVDHTWTCVTAGDNTCAYAYGRSGGIIDLTVPAAAKLLPGSWRKPVSYGDKSNSPYTHDLTEIRPGLVMSAGSSNILMDTTDPTAPKLLNKLDQASRFPSLGYHSVEWANGGDDRWLVLGTEVAPSGATNSAGSDCNGPESVIETWDASDLRQKLQTYFTAAPAARAALRPALVASKFVKKDSFSVNGRGLFLDGAAPGHVLYCAHWMEQHPDFADSGLLTVSYYDRGTRFLQVGADGVMTEKGWIVAAEGYSGSSQWISDDVIYVMDYRRGLEVVRFDATKPASAVAEQDRDVIALGSLALTSAQTPAQGSPLAGLAAAGLAALLVLNVTVLRRRRRTTA